MRHMLVILSAQTAKDLTNSPTFTHMNPCDQCFDCEVPRWRRDETRGIEDRACDVPL